MDKAVTDPIPIPVRTLAEAVEACAVALATDGHADSAKMVRALAQRLVLAEPTDEEVEAAARCLASNIWTESWSMLSAPSQRYCLKQARAALAAFVKGRR